MQAGFYTLWVPVPQKRRVGLFGGTFDPPHLGHLQAAIAVKSQIDLDEVWFVVANDPWQKTSDRIVSPADVRVEMVAAAVEGLDGCVVDDREIRRGGITYTADTVEEILSERDDVELFLIVGQDTAQKITSTWHRPHDIFTLSTLVVVTRPGHHLDATSVPASSIFVEMTPVDISSSRIRDAVAAGESINHFTTDSVIHVIERHGLYRGDA